MPFPGSSVTLWSRLALSPSGWKSSPVPSLSFSFLLLNSGLPGLGVGIGLWLGINQPSQLIHEALGLRTAVPRVLSPGQKMLPTFVTEQLAAWLPCEWPRQCCQHPRVSSLWTERNERCFVLFLFFPPPLEVPGLRSSLWGLVWEICFLHPRLRLPQLPDSPWTNGQVLSAPLFPPSAVAYLTAGNGGVDSLKKRPVTFPNSEPSTWALAPQHRERGRVPVSAGARPWGA